jgi:hypothetical protein
MTFKLLESVLILASRAISLNKASRCLGPLRILQIMKDLKVASLRYWTIVRQISLPVILISQAKFSIVSVYEEGYLLLMIMPANWLWSWYFFNPHINNLAASKWLPLRLLICLDVSLINKIILEVNELRPGGTKDLSVCPSLLFDRTRLSFFELCFVSLAKIRLKHSPEITKTWIPHVGQRSIWIVYFWCVSDSFLNDRSRATYGWIQVPRLLVFCFMWHYGWLHVRAKI